MQARKNTTAKNRPKNCKKEYKELPRSMPQWSPAEGRTEMKINDTKVCQVQGPKDSEQQFASARSSLNQACLQHRSVGKRSSHRIRQARPIHVTGHVLEMILKTVDYDGDHLYPVPCKVFKDELHHVKSVDVDVGIPLVVFDTTIIQLLRRYHYTRSRNCGYGHK